MRTSVWANGCLSLLARLTPLKVITVGGIENDGSLWDQTTPEGNGNALGSITVSLAANEQCASSIDPNGSQTASGTSFAAPQVAGPAAYFMSFSSLQNQLERGGMTQVPLNVKNYIEQAAYYRGGGNHTLLHITWQRYWQRGGHAEERRPK